ncbi:MAG: hypothetical protein QHH09_03000 [Microgenomates group bacterium]|nr:hypothetical protein [Microgenomates group bacterium]
MDMSSGFFKNLINLLFSINKLSLLAFFITLIFLIYEIILFKKDLKKKSKPNVPNFNETAFSNINTATQIITQTKEEKKSPNFLPIVIALVLVVFFGWLSFFGIANLQEVQPQVAPEKKQTEIQFVSSNGIRIFNQDWQELKSSEDINRLKFGDRIIIGLETINGLDIDRARIRVNQEKWSADNITTLFNKDYKVFYKDYQLATGTAKFKIEAQLHSVKDGWLGD